MQVQFLSTLTRKPFLASPFSVCRLLLSTILYCEAWFQLDYKQIEGSGLRVYFLVCPTFPPKARRSWTEQVPNKWCLLGELNFIMLVTVSGRPREVLS